VWHKGILPLATASKVVPFQNGGLIGIFGTGEVVPF
jgi:hypothetical protein